MLLVSSLGSAVVVILFYVVLLSACLFVFVDVNLFIGSHHGNLIK